MGRHVAEETGSRNPEPPAPPRTPLPLLHRVPIIGALMRGGEWSRADTLAALAVVVAIVVGAWTIMASFHEKNPDLHLDAVQVTRSSTIDAVRTDPTSTSRAEATGSVIDITLRNRGDAAALVVRADVSFQRATQLENCSGAGPGLEAAQFDVKVPTDPKVTDHPFIRQRDMRVSVDPNGLARLAISIGPDSFGDSEWPWIYQINVRLVEDSGEALDVGNVAMAGYTGSSWNRLDGVAGSLTSDAAPCYSHDADIIAAAMRAPGYHSPELQTLADEAKEIQAALHPCSPDETSGVSCATTVGRYITDPRGVTRCRDGLEVVHSYNCEVAEAVAAAYGPWHGYQPEPLTVSSGLLSLPLSCSATGPAVVCRSTDNQNLVVGFVP